MQITSTSVPAPAATLEKVPHAAKRMGISTCQCYREIKAGRLLLIKIGERASAIPSTSVDAWIQSKIDAAHRVAK